MHEPELELRVAWQRHVDPGATPLGTTLLDGLLSRHREKHRRYHTVVHVAWVVRHVGELAAYEPVDHLDEVIAAAFYHDAVYEPRSPSNERASARLARRDLATLGWSDERTRRVASMVEATVHDASTPTGDAAVLVDADLAILGAEPGAYSAYSTAIRTEYRHLDDAVWRRGRSAVLAGFLARATIYTTGSAQVWWESRARLNLLAELSVTSGV